MPKRIKQKKQRKMRNLLRDWSKQVRDRDNNICQICLQPHKQLNAHHVVDKANKDTRYLLANGVSLCPLHHKFGQYSAHKHPIWFTHWFVVNKISQYLVLKDYIWK